MKKNITINLQGRLYDIDEDAYALLKQYEDSLRRYFGSGDDGREIVDDIENRIAELFDELKAGGKIAIDIDDVQRIITRIGNPQQMDDETHADDANADGTGADGSEEPQADTAADMQEGESVWQKIRNIFVRPDRRLYRDPQDKKILGVISGLSHYYGGDVTAWRLVIVGIGVLLLILPYDWDEYAFYMLIIYFVLGMVIPVASSPEDRLRMNGKDVNPQNLAEEVTSEGKKASEKAEAATNGNRQRGCLSVLGDLIAGFIKILAWFVFGIIMIVFISLLAGLAMLLFAPGMAMFTDNGVTYSWISHPWVGTIGLLSLVVLIVLCIYGVCYGLLGKRSEQPMSTAGRIGFIILFIASFVGSIVCGTIIVSDLNKQAESFHITSLYNWQKRHTYDGVVLDDDDWQFFKSGGWHIIDHENCGDHYSATGEYYTGNEERRYLDCFNEGGQQKYRVERTDSMLAPGTYTLSAVVRTDGDGAFIYAEADGKTILRNIPAEGNTGGQIWQDAKSEMAAILADSVDIGKYKILKTIADANDGNGYGWSRITITGIRTKTGKISYGVTTGDGGLSFDPFVGTWVSATDFKLQKE